MLLACRLLSGVPESSDKSCAVLDCQFFCWLWGHPLPSVSSYPWTTVSFCPSQKDWILPAIWCLLPAGDYPSSAVVWQSDGERRCTCAVDVDKQFKLILPTLNASESSLIAKTLVFDEQIQVDRHY